VIATFAVLLTFALGVNVTTLQLAPDARLVPQVFVSAKSLALVPMLKMPRMEGEGYSERRLSQPGRRLKCTVDVTKGPKGFPAEKVLIVEHDVEQ
jgi:hypothetical protein